MESTEKFVLKYKNNCQNESMIKNLPKKKDILILMLMLFQTNKKD